MISPAARTCGLDWRDRSHWGGGRRLPCRYCGGSAFCRDDTGRPAHKTYAEHAITSNTNENTASTDWREPIA